MMAALPVEIVSNIMRFLAVSDRKEAALVNHIWYEAFLDPIIQKDTVVTFPANAGSQQIFSRLATRKTPNLILEHMDDSDQLQFISPHTLDYLKNHLLSLSLKGSNITESTFMSLVTKCHSLKKLDIASCNGLFMSGVLLSKPADLAAVCNALQNLKELNLSSIRHLSNSTFNRLVAVAPNLEKLSLANLQFVFHSVNYCGESSSVHSAVLTFDNLQTILFERVNKIKALDLSRTAINDDALVSLSRIENLCLKEMYLVNCKELTANGLAKLPIHQPNLTVLDLSQCTEVTDNVVKSICVNLCFLQQLSLKKCIQVSERAMTYLYKLRDLQSLDLSSCYSISEKALIPGLCKPVEDYSKLKILTLNCCSAIKDAFLVEASKKLTNLTNLDLSSTSITDKGLLMVSKFMTKLRSLELAWCKGISDEGLLGTTDAMTNMKPVELDNLCRCTRKHEKSHIFNKPIEHQEHPKHVMEVEMNVRYALDDQPVPLSNLRNLEHLDLSATKVSDRSLTRVLPGLLQLRSLSLAMCADVTDNTLLVIVKSNSCLEDLDISHNTNYTDSAMGQVAYWLLRVSSLNISNCEHLTDESIHFLERYCQRLKTLDISMNINITSKAVEKLETNLKNLNGLHKRLIIVD